MAKDRRVKGAHEKHVHVDRAAKERKARTASRSRSLKEARSGSGGSVQDLSPTALYLTLLGGLLVVAAFTYWLVVIAWDPKTPE